MRAYYDTEFCARLGLIVPLSVGVATDTAREFYSVVDLTTDPCGHDIGIAPFAARHDWTWCAHMNPWLVDNVYPSLPIRLDGDGNWVLDPTHPDIDRVKPAAQIAGELLDFLIGDREPIELWSNFGAYDHVLLGNLFGGMEHWPGHLLPMFDRDLQHEHARLGQPHLPEQATGLHNALADARYNRQIGELMRVIPPPRVDLTRRDRCPSCHTPTGVRHGDDCTVARCLLTGVPRMVCGEHHHHGADVWTGLEPGVEEAAQYGVDLAVLTLHGVWDPTGQRYVLGRDAYQLGQRDTRATARVPAPAGAVYRTGEYPTTE